MKRLIAVFNHAETFKHIFKPHQEIWSSLMSQGGETDQLSRKPRKDVQFKALPVVSSPKKGKPFTSEACINLV